jgi:hypothetical protein
MPVRVLFGSFVLAVAIAIAGLAQENGKTETDVGRQMPVYITPFYESEGLKITVGEHSQTLANADAKSIREIAGALKKEKDKLRAEVMYVTAIRLYDLGHKDEAVYWFYTAQYRARLFTTLLDNEKIGTIGDEAFELKHAYNAFNQLAGIYINGYGFGDSREDPWHRPGRGAVVA